MIPDRFATAFRERLGAAEPSTAHMILEASLRALGEQLPHEQAMALANALPEALALLHERHAHPHEPNLDRFVARTAELSGVPRAHALEAAQVLCACIVEGVEPDVVARVRRALPADFAAWFEPSFTPAPDAMPAHPPGHAASKPRTTLAEGHPGSRHPVSEAAPQAAHSQSVAESANPHADTKLSSSPGTMQERSHDTVAGGAPGSKRPLSEG